MNKAKTVKQVRKGFSHGGSARHPGSRKKFQEGNFLQDVLHFRWLKKAMMGKSRSESLDLLDRWILRKKPLALLKGIRGLESRLEKPDKQN